MNAPPSQIIAGLDVAERRITSRHLIRSGAIAREAEAKHLLEMIREARLYIEDAELQR